MFSRPGVCALLSCCRTFTTCVLFPHTFAKMYVEVNGDFLFSSVWIRSRQVTHVKKRNKQKEEGVPFPSGREQLKKGGLVAVKQTQAIKETTRTKTETRLEVQLIHYMYRCNSLESNGLAPTIRNQSFQRLCLAGKR